MGRILELYGSPSYGVRKGSGLAIKPGAGQVGVRLAWDANPAGDNVTDYRVHYGNASGVYNGVRTPISVGTDTTYLWLPSDMSGTVFFAVTATNAEGTSAFSNEVSKLL
jgi:hypothetical protein